MDVEKKKKIEFLIIEKSNSHNMTEKTANKAVICSSSQGIISKKKRERKNVVQIKAGRVAVTKQRRPRAREITMNEARGESKDSRLQTPNNESAAFV